METNWRAVNGGLRQAQPPQFQIRFPAIELAEVTLQYFNYAGS
jgi:hypothetical protein